MICPQGETHRINYECIVTQYIDNVNDIELYIVFLACADPISIGSGSFWTVTLAGIA